MLNENRFPLYMYEACKIICVEPNRHLDLDVSCVLIALRN